MGKKEIIARLKDLADHAVYRDGDGPYLLSLDDGIALHEAAEMLEQDGKPGGWKPMKNNCNRCRFSTWDYVEYSNSTDKNWFVDGCIKGLEPFENGECKEFEENEGVC